MTRTTAFLAAALATLMAGCSVSTGAVVAAPATEDGVPVLLRFDGSSATATLTDSPEARQFAALLPVTVQLQDVWGQARSGRLPRPLAVEGTTPVHDPEAGGIYFWPLSEVIAVYYDDLGQTVPDPGLIRLGVVDTGLAELADATSATFVLRGALG